MIFSVDKHTLFFFFSFYFICNALSKPVTQHMVLASSSFSSYQTSVDCVHQPLLRCPLSWCHLLGQSKQTLPEHPREAENVPHPLFHHTAAALSFQPPMGWIVQAGRDQLVRTSAQCRANIKVRPGCSMLFPVRLDPPRMEISPCLWALALVLNHSPFEPFFSSSRFFSQNFPCCSLWSSPLVFCCAPLSRVWLHLPCNSPLGTRRH